MRKSNSKRICGEFLIEVAVLAFEGVTIEESAKRLDCNVRTIRKARDHEMYDEIYSAVLQQGLLKRVAQVA